MEYVWLKHLGVAIYQFSTAEQCDAIYEPAIQYYRLEEDPESSGVKLSLTVGCGILAYVPLFIGIIIGSSLNR